MDGLLESSGASYRGQRPHSAVLILLAAVLHFHLGFLYVSASQASVIRGSHAFHRYSLIPIFHGGGSKHFSFDADSSEILASICSFLIGASMGYFASATAHGYNTASPKYTLATACGLNAIVMVASSLIPSFWPVIVLRFLSGFLTAAANASLWTLLLDWSHRKFQVLTMHHTVGSRFAAVAMASLLLWTSEVAHSNTWREYLLLASTLLVILAVLSIIFVKHSPAWVLRSRGRDAYARLITQFASDLGLSRGSPLLESRVVEVDTEDRSRGRTTAPTLVQLTIVVATYVMNSTASLALQTSSGYELTWATEVTILAVCQVAAYVAATFLRKSTSTYLAISMTALGFISFLAMLLPGGMFFNLLVELSKLLAATADHLALFFLLDVGHVYTNDIRTRSPTLAKRRSHLLMVAEGVASLTRIVSIVLFIQTPTSPSARRVRIPKLLTCTVLYLLYLAVLLIFAVTKLDEPAVRERKPTGDETPDEPVTPLPPKPKEPELIEIPALTNVIDFNL